METPWLGYGWAGNVLLFLFPTPDGAIAEKSAGGALREAPLDNSSQNVVKAGQSPVGQHFAPVASAAVRIAS
jgi:hypothetical protein